MRAADHVDRALGILRAGDASYAPGSKGTSRVREVGGKYVVEVNHGSGWDNVDGVDYLTEAKARAAQQLWVKYGVRSV